MILSRVAETIYWMARYVERAENTARIIMVNANLLLDLPKGIAPGWEPILAITGSSKLFYEHYSELNERNVVKFLISDRFSPGSIINSVDNARENLRTSRAIAPRGVWEVLNDLHYYVEKNKTKGISRKGRYEYLKHVIRSCQLINGSITGTMSHDQTYEFVCLGRSLERADMTTRVLEVRTRDLLPDLTNELQPFDDIQWKSILESLAAYQMYRRHVRLRVKGSAVLGYLLQDKQFPHSVGYCITEVENSLRSLPDNEACLRTLGRVQRQVFDADVTDMGNSRLDEFLNGLQIILGHVHDQLAATYFKTERLTQDSSVKSEAEDTKNEFAA
jgi:uncharacterized alpha-E superfamily protein